MKIFTLLFALILCTIFGVNTINGQTLPKPIANYTFDEGAGDKEGNFDGTFEGDAAIVDDEVRGGVLSLTENGYVSLPVDIAANLENFSFSTWINYNGTVKWAGLLGIGKSTQKTFPYFDFHMRNDLILSFYSSLNVVWPADGCAMTVDSFKMSLGEWVHLAYSFTLNKGLEVYVNGVVKTNKVWTGPNDFHVAPNAMEAEVVVIGRDAFNQGTLTNTKIDDFRIFDFPLTAEEVMTIYEDDGKPVIPNSVTRIKDYHIARNYPNPFSDKTTIQYEIPEGSHVKLSVLNISGQEIAILANGYKSAGTYSESFDRANLLGGVYFYRLESNGHSSTNKMILVK